MIYIFSWYKAMKKTFPHLVFACAVGILIGCYNPERDLSIDPYNTPLIHILEAAYDANAGVVVVQWEYLGQKRVENFVLQRRDNISGFRNIERSSGTDAQDRYATVGAFQDRELFAGERLQYRVVAEHSEGGLVSTSAVEIPIPGAGLREIRRNPIALDVQLVWKLEAGEVATYEVIRAPEGGDYETIFVTQDAQQTSFLDRSIPDNRPYIYAIRTHMSTGVKHTSRSIRMQFYREAGRYVVDPLIDANERIRLSIPDPYGEADMLALIVRPNQILFFYLQHTLSVDMPNTLSHRLVSSDAQNAGYFRPKSVDLVGPSSLEEEGAFSRAYISGLDSIGRVGIVPIEWSRNTKVQWAPSFLNWVSASSHVRLAQDSQRRFYIATGGQLRVYSSARFSGVGSPIGAFDLEYRDPVDIAVHKGVIWIAWANGIQRGVLFFSGEVLDNIAWESVLHTQIEPRALTLNAAGQVFVLDRTQVHVFRANGEEFFSWPLPSGTFSAGDLTFSRPSLNFLHLSDESGGVITYVP
ncbi:MAG: hypothetical protein F4W91_03905 [Gemmatimonadetes bacterium]|nr:hypothetical protein [Gemmatimonadota bacterium]